MADQFEVLCNDSTRPPRLFLASSAVTYQKNGEASISNASARVVLDEAAISPSPIELLDIAVAANEVRAYGAVSSYCIKSPAEQVLKLQLTSVGPSNTSWPLTLSMKRNALVGVGMNMQARLARRMYMDLPSLDALTSCSSVAAIDDFYSPENGSCVGYGCCKVPFAGRAGRRAPIDLSEFAVSFRPGNQLDWEEYPCSYGMVVETSWYNFSTPELYGYEVLPKKLQRGVPFVLDFAILNGSCPAKGQQPPPGYACASSNSFCTNTNTTGYVCHCIQGYEGNPYITNGCQDIDECKDPYLCPRRMQCINLAGSYECKCKSGTMIGAGGECIDIISTIAKVVAGGVGFILLLVILFIIIIQKEKRKTKGFYQKNGGLILENANFLKLYQKKELKPILKSMNFIGKGGFGQVYKGVLRNVLVAVKKPINGSVLENEQFANEVFIQSQINHKNIVRLIGCCLEVDIPMLVYEFLSKGLLTEKSDVYSFGVVILELISRERATYSNNNSLVRKFVEAHKKEVKSTEYFDKEIAVTRDLEILDCLAEVAVECLGLDVDQRPTMTEVAERLLKLSRSREL
ncbi:hypothetical protein QYE76_008653 [Lolium multiflorum]|uniref:Uncharacterized protein n=1 Tax=Lolium multiflorum TaxID=4521 RepID=A0AAD8TQI0_LOLMU|nr:hypothetical protein QYE76_008653 [Lolium multiflorum]